MPKLPEGKTEKVKVWTTATQGRVNGKSTVAEAMCRYHWTISNQKKRKENLGVQGRYHD